MLLAGMALAGCASLAPPKPAAPVAAASASLPAFDAVIREARRVEGGALTLYRRDEKVWIELPSRPAAQSYFLSPRLQTGIGEAGIFGGLMASRSARFGRPQIIEFRRLYNQIQMVAVNTAYQAAPDSAAAYAVQSAYSPSLLGSAPIVSAPHPVRGTVLVEAQGLFTTDMLGIASQLNQAYRQAYALDARNTAVTSTRTGADGTSTVEVSLHFATPSVAAAAPGSVVPPTLPNALPDARSLFVTVAFDISALPREPMPARRADPRVGHFTTAVSDFSRDLDRRPLKHYVNRWRLEPADGPGGTGEAQGTAPREPIVFWIDRGVPKAYRQAITDGALEWNKAFARIGWRDVVQVRQQPDDSTADVATLGRASIRWMTNSTPAFGAIGPSHVDPRSGEILRAHVALESLSPRAVRAARAQILGALGTPAASAAADACEYGALAADELGFGLDALTLRGQLDPDSPEVERFVLAYIKDTTMHEVGHALGLRHNFRASRLHSLAELDSPRFTADHALAASVMDYLPMNLPAPGAPGGSPFNTTLGPYDYWAIEYAYRRLPVDSEAATLAAIARRAGRPDEQAALDYGTDEDFLAGVDPEAMQFDLGDDPVAFARRRLAIADDLLTRLGQPVWKPDEDYTRLRRTAAYVLRDLGRSAAILVRQIGGLRTYRDYPGSPRDPLQPVPAPRQRAALQLLMQGYLGADRLQLPPAVVRKLAPDFLDRGDAGLPSDLSWTQSVLDLQRNVLSPLMAEEMLIRLQDVAELADRGPRAAAGISPRELLQTLERTLWDGPSRSADPARRHDLQREHAARLAALVLRPGVPGRADAQAAAQEAARRLLSRVRRDLRARHGDPMQQAHLTSVAATLQRALEARPQRGTP